MGLHGTMIGLLVILVQLFFLLSVFRSRRDLWRRDKTTLEKQLVAVHERSLNDFQILLSLIHLQMNTGVDLEPNAPLTKIWRQALILAHLHRQSIPAITGDRNKSVELVIRKISDTYGFKENNVKVRCDTGIGRVDRDLMRHILFMINELMYSSVNLSTVDVARKIITFDLGTNASNILITMNDNGGGFSQRDVKKLDETSYLIINSYLRKYHGQWRTNQGSTRIILYTQD